MPRAEYDVLLAGCISVACQAAAVRSSLYILLFGKRRSLYTLNSPCVCLFLIPSPSFQPHESLASPPVLMANTFYNSGPLRPRFFSLVLFCVKSTVFLCFFLLLQRLPEVFFGGSHCRDGFSLTQQWPRMKFNGRSIWSTQT